MEKLETYSLFSRYDAINVALSRLKKQLVISPLSLFLLTAVFIILVANSVFFTKLTAVYPWQEHISFIVSLSLLTIALTCLLMLLLNVILPTKVVVITLLLISALVDYYAVAFGVLIDKTMLQNIAETDIAEAKDIITLSLGAKVLLLAILPSVILCQFQLKSFSRLQSLRQQALSILAIVIIIPLLIAPFSAQYSSFFRLHKELRYYTNPLFPIYSAFSYAANTLSSAHKKEFVRLTQYIEKNSTTKQPKLMILVVGETVRADHLALNGYQRDTTPNLSQQPDLINFSNVSSCGTSTAVSVPCMFSFSGREDFDINSAKTTENVLDVLATSGVSVIWRDNNSSSKGVADRLTYQSYRSSDVNTECDVECRDLGMLVGLQQYINQQNQDTLIVLHQMGNHGPAYYKRYPASFEFFTPACQSAELSDCSKDEIINAYDNAIRYTDHFLAEVIGLLKANSAQYNTVMLYVSDHGESLGENGLYLHGMPYSFAPKAQTHIPMVAWFSAPYIDAEKTKTHQRHPYSHDALSSTLLSLFEVSTDLDLPKDISSTLFYFKTDVGH